MKFLDVIDSLVVCALRGVGLLILAVLLPFLIPLALLGWLGKEGARLVDRGNR